MKYLLLAIIHFYWLIPKKWRKKCVFKHTCSLHVYSSTKAHGIIEGFKSLQHRFKQCRPIYSIYKTDDGIEWVILADKSVIKRIETNI